MGPGSGQAQIVQDPGSVPYTSYFEPIRASRGSMWIMKGDPGQHMRSYSQDAEPYISENPREVFPSDNY